MAQNNLDCAHCAAVRHAPPPLDLANTAEHGFHFLLEPVSQLPLACCRQPGSQLAGFGVEFPKHVHPALKPPAAGEAGFETKMA